MKMAESGPVLAPPWSQKITCRYFIHGFCKEADNCQYSHDLPSSNVCKYYRKSHCSYGDKCRYDHGQHSPSGASQPEISKHKPLPILKDRTPATSRMVTLKKQGTSVDGGVEPDVSCVKSPMQYSSIKCPKDWVKAAEFIPGKPYKGGFTYSKAVGGQHTHKPEDLKQCKELLCPYQLHKGHCVYEEACVYTHGVVCDLCGNPALFPGDKRQNEQHMKVCVEEHERAMEESFAIQRSKDKICGICMDLVMEKQPPSERRFGILSDCKHVYCLDCIRKWRSAKQFEKKTVRSCPECRTKSDYIVPSKYWAEEDEDKKKIIDGYKSVLSTKSCKYFDQGRGECPFYDKCFYLHAYPDGKKAEPKPRPPRRKHQNDHDEVDLMEQMILWDFLEERQNQLLQHALDFDDDLIELLQVLHGWDSSSDDDSDYDLW